MLDGVECLLKQFHPEWMLRTDAAGGWWRSGAATPPLSQKFSTKGHFTFFSLLPCRLDTQSVLIRLNWCQVSREQIFPLFPPQLFLFRIELCLCRLRFPCLSSRGFRVQSASDVLQFFFSFRPRSAMFLTLLCSRRLFFSASLFFLVSFNFSHPTDLVCFLWLSSRFSYSHWFVLMYRFLIYCVFVICTLIITFSSCVNSIPHFRAPACHSTQFECKYFYTNILFFLLSSRLYFSFYSFLN